jgi:hypothetical protein
MRQRSGRSYFKFSLGRKLKTPSQSII